MIKYINKIPSKIEYFDMVRSVDESVDVSTLSEELDNTVLAVCAYNGDRLVGMGRIKCEEDFLCIEDLIIKLEPCKEEIERAIIIELIKQINVQKLYDMDIRKRLNMSMFGEDYGIYKESPVVEEQEENANRIIGA